MRPLRALAILFLIAFPASLAAETRVALVIGNGAYRHAPMLANPPNDARAVTATLRRLDFAVEEGLDLDIGGMRAALSRFADALQNADVGLFFYAGHGLQVQGLNYLVPVDGALSRETDLIFEAVDFANVLRLLEDRPRTSLVFLDACRDNPLRRSLARNLGQTRSQAVGQGLAEVESGIGTLIAYATEPGNVAMDGGGKHSPFTTALLANLETPGLEVRQMLTRVRKMVIEQTAHLQVPWDHSSLTGDFYFKPLDARVDEQAPPVAQGDLLVWKAIEGSTEPEDFATFIEQYPDSALVPFARNRIDALHTQQPGEIASRAARPMPAAKVLKPVIGPPTAIAPAPDQSATAAEPAAARAAVGPSEPGNLPTVSSPKVVELALSWLQDDWREVQQALNALGHPSGQEDGLPGRQTRSAVAAWQQGSGDEPSGYLTAAQRARLLEQAKPQLAALVATTPPPALSQAPSDDTSEAARIRAAAEQGDAAAQIDLGFMYENGHGVPQDYAQAVTWYRKAAEQGEAWGQYNLGVMYGDGRGVPQDDAQAMIWFRKAAEQGNASGQRSLGIMYENGRGVRQDYAQAVTWYREAADQGDAWGQFNLGVMYGDGRGVPQDDAEAAAWYRRAAEQGNASGQRNLAVMYENGRGVVQDDLRAVTWFRKAAEQGDARGQVGLGLMYADGRGVVPDDIQAVTWFRIAAEQGDAWGQNNLGTMYEYGRGVPLDYAQAVAWYRKAAAQGNALGQHNLGGMYENGHGVPRNLAEAASWYREAAAQGNPSAIKALRRLGRPVPAVSSSR